MSDNERTIQADGHLHGVIVGCRADDRWLLIRRSHLVAAPLSVCFPGGGIDGDESQAAAVVREMQEELGALVTPLHCCWTTVFRDRAVTLWGWCAELHTRDLTPDPAEVAEVLWLTEQELRREPQVLPGTLDFLRAAGSWLDQR